MIFTSPGDWARARALVPAPATPAHRPVVIQIGLSPLVRGNRSTSLHLYRYAGSIPARAGKPLRVDEFQKTYITNTQNVTMIIAANITIESLIVQPPFFP